MNDLRFAVRQLLKRKGFSFIAVTTLTIGIGASTAIFSVVDHLMLRDLPYPDPDRIVTLWQNNQRENLPRDDVAPGNYLEWRERAEAFAAIGAAEPFSMDLLVEGQRPEILGTSLVTEGFFEALGVQPYRGRLLLPDDFRQDQAQVVLISYELWQRRFGGDPGIVGSALTLDRVPRVVVGIMPPHFNLALMQSVHGRDVWAPRIMQGWERNSRSSSWWTVLGRLKADVSLAQAQADMDRVAANLATEFPATNDRIGVAVVPLHEHLVGAARPALLLLLGAVGLVLLIACANVANLQLARATERINEFAVRSALGAERHRIVRQLLTESLMLAVVGAGAGALLAFWGVDLIKALSPGTIPRLETVAVDIRVLVFALALGIGSALLFGLAPALQFSRPQLQAALREGKGTAGRTRQRLRNGLIVAETALALMLLIGATLLLRSFATILAVDPGFQRQNVLALQVFHYIDGESNQDRAEFFRSTLDEMRTLPGVRAAGAVMAAPFLAANIDIRQPFTVVDEPPPREGEESHLYLTQATPGFFDALNVPLLRGRDFTEFDRFDTPRVAVINETMRRRYWLTADPIGKQLLIGQSQTPVEIVGVVGDVRHEGLDIEPRPELFLAHGQSGTGSMTYFVRVDGNAASLMSAAHEAVWRANPVETFYQTGTIEQLISATLTGRRFTLVLLTVFAGIALAMAAVGIYGLMSFTVNQRIHEVGIRMALGADRSAVVGLIVRQGVMLAATGVLFGVGIAFFGTQVMTSMLFGIPPRDVISFTLGVVVLVGAALLACYLPARRATRVDPMIALRYE